MGYIFLAFSLAPPSPRIIHRIELARQDPYQIAPAMTQPPGHVVQKAIEQPETGVEAEFLAAGISWMIS